MNREHENNFEAVYQTLYDIAREQNSKLEADRGHPLHNFDTLHSEATGENNLFTLSDGRTMNVKWVRIPTFSHQNKPLYHTIFLVNTEWWEAKNAPSIEDLCKQLLQYRTSDRYTIFLCGKQKQFRRAKDDALLRKHNIVIFNTNHNGVDDIRQRIFLRLEKFYRRKCIRLWTTINKQKQTYTYYSTTNGGYETGERRLHLYGTLKQDWQRLNALADQLLMLAKQFWKIRFKKLRLKRLEREKAKQEKETEVKKELFTISKASSKTVKLNKKKERERAREGFCLSLLRAKVVKPV